jgi:hypothetical protein
VTGKPPDPANVPDESSAELSRLRNQVVALARELAVLRWEISSLMRQSPVSGRVSLLKYSVLRNFPKLAGKLGQGRRAARKLLAGLGRDKIRLPAPARVAAAGTSQRLLTPILLVDKGPFAQSLAATTPAADLISVMPGAGLTRSLPVQQTNEPALRLPMPGSLAHWLIEGAGRLRQFGTIVVDSGDDVSLALLRGRMTREQTLVLTPSPACRSALAEELGKPSSRAGDVQHYTHLPIDWLDPLDAQMRPVADFVAQREWPKISVVMVSLNQAAFLEEGLRSILDQDYPNLELLVVDGNSKDNSAEILERYRSRLDFLLIEPDRGQSDGLNKGFARATGEIVTWLNSDDLLEPGALFRVAQAFTSHKVDMVAGGCRQIGMTRETVIVDHHNRLPMGIPTTLPLGLLLEMDRFWLAASFFYQPEVFFTREIWQRCGGRLRTDLYYVLDYDLWVRMAAAGANIVHIPDFLACSRTHDQQKTTVGMPYLPEVQRLLHEYASKLATPPS